MSDDRRITKYCKLKPRDVLCNKYRVVERLGSGRFSIVYKVEDSTGHQFAVKVYRRGTSNKDYFDNELAICKHLHEHRFEEESKYVVSYVDAFAHLHERPQLTSLHPCITYNILGDSLRKLLDYVDAGMPIKTSKKIMREVLSGLKFLHGCGIIHADIKASNVLLTRRIDDISNNDEISVVVADIGSATFEDELFSHRIGTQEYLSPEAIFCTDYGTPTDIWSAMCLCYEIVTGDYLFNLEEYEEVVDNTVEIDESGNDSDDTEISSGLSDDGSDDGHSGGNHMADDDNLCKRHLLMIESLLGPMPLKLAKKGRQYYNNRGRLKENPRIIPNSIQKKILNDFESIEPRDAEEVEKFILSGMKYLPDERPSAAELLRHPWLN
jgi:serine/threonine protein kinase